MTSSTLHWTAAGGRDGRPSIVLLHGLLGSSADWQPLIDRWSVRHRVVAMDLRGHGRSPPARDPLDLETLTTEVSDTLCGAEPGWGGWVLMGVSMGALVALRVAARLRSRARGLLLASVDAAPERPELLARRLATLALAERLGPPPVLRAVAPGMFGKTTRRERPELVESWLTRALSVDATSVRRVVEAALTRRDSRPLLSHVSCPVLLVSGEEDEVTPATTVEELAAALPAARFAAIPAAGHSPHLEQPERVAEEAQWLLRRI